MTIHERLKSARIRAGFGSAAAAAEGFGWPVGTYCGHENGSRGIRLAVAERYAQAFRVSDVWLVNGVGRPDDGEMHAVHRVPVHAVTVPIGVNNVEIKDAPVTGYQYFGRDWMLTQQLSPSRCAVVRYDGAWTPDLIGPCWLLIDLSAQGRTRRAGRLYLFCADRGIEVARARRSPTGEWRQYVADTAEWDWPESTRILGEIRWAMRTFGPTGGIE